MNVQSLMGGVHFFVQRNTSFDLVYTVVTFEVARLNVGGAMDVKRGVFTAPVPGVYHFGFKGMKSWSDKPLAVVLRLNEFIVASTYEYGSFTLQEFRTGVMQATLKLRKGDRVDLFNLGNGVLDENTVHNHHNTQFTGSLLDEDSELII